MHVLAMETKVCGRCASEKPIDEFGFRYVDRGIRHSWCKGCMAEYKSAWYERNRAKHIAHVRAARDQTGDENQILMWQYLAVHPCVGCGERDRSSSTSIIFATNAKMWPTCASPVSRGRRSS